MHILRSEVNTVEFICVAFPLSGRNEVHVHTQTKYKLCNSGDSTYKLNAFKLALHNIKMVKFMLMVLNFNFSFL